MSKPLPFTQSAVRCAIKAAHKEGLRVVCIRPDGSLVVDSGDSPHPLIPDSAQGSHGSKPSVWEDLEV